MPDFSKLFLFIVLALVVLVLVAGPGKRPLASAPKDPDADAGQQTSDDASMISRGAGFANVASNYSRHAPPLMLIMPDQGGTPTVEICG